MGVRLSVRRELLVMSDVTASGRPSMGGIIRSTMFIRGYSKYYDVHLITPCQEPYRDADARRHTPEVFVKSGHCRNTVR